MKRRNFLTTCAAIVTSGLTWKAAAAQKQPKANENPSSTDEQYVVVNNWYLKKEDLKTHRDDQQQ